MEYVEEFLDYLVYQKNYSEHTKINYEEDLNDYFSFLKKESLDYKTIEYSDIRFYLMYLKEEKKEKNSSINRHLSSLRSFYKYLLNKKIVKNNVFLYLNGPKKEKKLPRYFEYQELEELFLIPDTHSATGQRDLLILELLYATGIRVAELVSIRLKDIHLQDRTILILGKGNKERMVPYGEYAADILDKYLHQGREELNIHKTDFLLLNHRGEPLTDRGVRYILDQIIKKTSLQKHISPHMLRHTFATHLLNEGCDLLSVQKLLGHESIQATQIYTHVTTEKLKDVYYHSFPRAKMNKNTKN